MFWCHSIRSYRDKQKTIQRLYFLQRFARRGVPLESYSRTGHFSLSLTVRIIEEHVSILFSKLTTSVYAWNSDRKSKQLFQAIY